jgi:hypothetical protein
MNPAIHNFTQNVNRRQRIAQAAAVADCGHVPKALAMCEAVPTANRHAEDWDLMARLFTRMSRFRDAREAWEQAGRAGLSPAFVQQALTALDARHHTTLIAIVLVAAAVGMMATLTVLALLAVFL